MKVQSSTWLFRLPTELKQKSRTYMIKHNINASEFFRDMLRNNLIKGKVK
jgi:hypothetical protein